MARRFSSSAFICTQTLRYEGGERLWLVENLHLVFNLLLDRFSWFAGLGSSRAACCGAGSHA